MIRRLLVCAAAAAMAAACQPAANADAVEAPAATQTGQAPADGAITPEEVEAMISADGPSATWATLIDSANGEVNDRSGPIFEGIAAGDPAWVALLPELRSGSDGWFGESLSIAMTQGLKHNASGILAAIDPTPEDAPYLCPPLSESGSPEYDNAADHAATIAAVEAVSEPDLQAFKTECLASLRG